MARYSKRSQLETYEVLRLADDFSDSEDWALKLIKRNKCCLSFESRGGRVIVAAAR